MQTEYPGSGNLSGRLGIVVFAGAGCYTDPVAINLHVARDGDRLVSG